MAERVRNEIATWLDDALAKGGRGGLISPAELARRLPNRPHVSTVWRWCHRGIRGVRLGTVAIGGRRYTTPALVEEFLARLSESGGPKGAPPPSPPPPDRRAREKARAAARAAMEF
ncbi:DUF1580 domain-containing protein [Tautonia plasticadhaerens]|uniref:Uncharacterized protein n=1 Tax=Tautonia plasticadhaerens TaxID=2527974 RepID=A0A518H6A5_9BACT|nr:DUF1580 domain-containing protein [Tautonia plasticadhaerens]QDV36363.1 hypothetical protein ElP_42830 [Tautonia plasticadhaerens]